MPAKSTFWLQTVSCYRRKLRYTSPHDLLRGIVREELYLQSAQPVCHQQSAAFFSGVDREKIL